MYKYVISGWQFVWFSPCCPQRDVDPDTRVTNASLALIPNAPGDEGFALTEIEHFKIAATHVLADAG